MLGSRWETSACRHGLTLEDDLLGDLVLRLLCYDLVRADYS